MRAVRRGAVRLRRRGSMPWCNATVIKCNRVEIGSSMELSEGVAGIIRGYQLALFKKIIFGHARVGSPITILDREGCC